MYYVYALKSNKTSWVYVGYTSDLKKRIDQHNKGLSKATKRYLPIELVYYEAYKSMLDAMKRESSLKGHGKAVLLLKKKLVNSLK